MGNTNPNTRHEPAAAAAAASLSNPAAIARLVLARLTSECEPASMGLHSATFQLNLSRYL